MSRFRLLPTPCQQVVLLEHCRHARFVWNLVVEQQQFWQPGRRAPGYNQQSAQLTEVRAVTRDRAGRWHVAFAHIPDAIPGPRNGSVVGVDRGVAVSAALSTGELLRTPNLTPGEQIRLRRKAGPCNADVNAARNIAAGRAVPAQGDLAAGRSVNCEPQLSSPAA